MKKMHKAMGLVAAASAVALVPQAQAADNPFGLSDSAQTIVVAGNANHNKGISVLDGKCGSGKCGSQRIRQMMDRNGDGRINRAEYINWASAQAGAEFDDIAKGANAVDADDVFKSFLEFEELTRQG